MRMLRDGTRVFREQESCGRAEKKKSDFSLFAHKRFISFSLFHQRTKRVFHRICCLSIIFFPFLSSGQLWRWYFIYSQLSRVFLFGCFICYQMENFFCIPVEGWKIYYSDFFVSFVVYGFRIGRPLFLFSVWGLVGINTKRKKSIGILFVCFSRVCSISEFDRNHWLVSALSVCLVCCLEAFGGVDMETLWIMIYLSRTFIWWHLQRS